MCGVTVGERLGHERKERNLDKENIRSCLFVFFFLVVLSRDMIMSSVLEENPTEKDKLKT